MISVLLMILKILGIIVLAVLCLLLLVLLLVLFVPVRYRITASRTPEEETPHAAKIRITWLLHIVNVLFDYPRATYVRVRIFCFTIFRSDKQKEEPNTVKQEAPSESENAEKEWEPIQPRKEEEAETNEEVHSEKDISLEEKAEEKKVIEETAIEEEATLLRFLKKLWQFIKNIGYTFRKIYDNIKHIVKNIRYYVKVLQSEIFRRAFDKCMPQIWGLIKYLRPRKIKGELIVGMNDPAATGQIMAVWGMLYPLIGEHIFITPDFDREILEGNILISGRITVFRLIRTAGVIYFNRDLRHLIQLFKKGGHK